MFDLAGYAEHGFAAPLSVLTEPAASALYERVATVRRDRPDVATQAFGSNCHLLFPWLYDLTLNDAVLDAVATVIGPNILIWSASFFHKQPGSAGYVSWHQDSTYWGLEPPEIVTAWIALTPSTPQSGCLRVVPGSHQRGQIAHNDTFAQANLLSRGQEIQVDVDETAAHDVSLRPGEMSLHHVRLIHGSNPNAGTLPRVGFAVRYIPTHVRQSGGRTYAALARGRDEYGNFDTPTRPDADMSPAAWQMQQDSLRRLNTVLMKDTAQPSKVDGHRPRP